MTSIILIVAAAFLMVLMTVALLYFNSGGKEVTGARTEATLLLEQGQKLLGAASQYQEKHGEWPADLAVLVDSGFLAEVPRSIGRDRTGVSWSMPAEGVPVFSLTAVATEAVCREVNNVARNVDGIPLKAYSSLTAQCYGANEQALTVVVSAAGADLLHALPAGHALDGAAPSNPAGAGWLRAPLKGGSAEAEDAPDEPGVGMGPMTVGDISISFTRILLEPTVARQDSVLPVPLTLSNAGDEPIEVHVLEAGEGLAVGLGTCEEGIPARGDCELQVTFRASSIGAHEAATTLQIGDHLKATVTVVGQGVAPEAPEGSVEVAGLRASFQGLDFGEVVQTGMAGAEPLVLTNVGSEPIVLERIAVSDEVDFFADYASCMETDEPGTLASGESCRVELSFTPASLGLLEAALMVTFEGGEHILKLSGFGQEMALAAVEVRVDGFRLGKEALNLGTQSETVAVGGRFRQRAVRLVNTGGQAITFTGATLVQREGVQGFTASANLPGELGGCERIAVLQPEEFCDLYIGYTATNRAGVATAELTARFQDQVGGTLEERISVVAKAYGGWLTLVDPASGTENVFSDTPGGWNFERVAVGSRATKQFHLRNKGLAPVTLRALQLPPVPEEDEVVVTGSAPAPMQGALACAASQELKPGEHCLVTLTFAPTQLNPHDIPSKLRVEVQTDVATVGEGPRLGGGGAPNMLGWEVKGWVKP